MLTDAADSIPIWELPWPVVATRNGEKVELRPRIEVAVARECLRDLLAERLVNLYVDHDLESARVPVEDALNAIEVEANWQPGPHRLHVLTTPAGDEALDQEWEAAGHPGPQPSRNRSERWVGWEHLAAPFPE